MQNRYPLWKYILLILICIVGFLYALPNIFGEEEAIQISPNNYEASVSNELTENILNQLKEANIPIKGYQIEGKDLLIRFMDADTQFRSKDIIQKIIGDDYTTALTLLSTTPRWLKSIGANPMKLGLDLRGGVHLLLEVDIHSIFERREEGLIKSISKILREAQIRYVNLKRNKDEHSIDIGFKSIEDRDNAYKLIQKNESEVTIQKVNDNYPQLIVAILPQAVQNIRQNTIEQTMSTLRNRVNELGVAEAVVQQQGAYRIAVDLPGIQDATHAKTILGGTATLEFRMVDHENDPVVAAQSGHIPIGSKLYYYNNRPYLLKTQIILSGDSITGAMSSFDQDTVSPSVQIQLGGGGESLFHRVTRENINKSMAIVFVETKASPTTPGEIANKTRKKIERVISLAQIRSALGSRFQITGLTNQEEAKNLALLLRAGALPAAVDIVEERTVGPTLGLENIKRGLVSLEIAILLIVVFTLAYYRAFGFIADVALLLNLVLLVAILSLIGATLTLPGIAAIVLTMGMAVDTNVLIYERIREELRNGSTPQAAIYAGYERAFSTIVDANLTTLIVAVILLAIGSGPIQNFAITLIFGLMTSMLTGVACTRAIVNIVYGGRRIKRLSIGI